jgi:hypothetical protein
MQSITFSTSAHKPSATIINFPYERRFAIRVERETNDLGWLIVTNDREHGWLHGDFNAAIHDAREVAATYDVAVQSSAGRVAP